MSKPDKLARNLAATALGVALLALVLAGYAVHQGQTYLEDVRVMGEAMEQNSRRSAPLDPPPIQLDVD